MEVESKRCGNCESALYDEEACEGIGAYVCVCNGVERGNEFKEGFDSYTGLNCDRWIWDGRNY